MPFDGHQQTFWYLWTDAQTEKEWKQRILAIANILSHPDFTKQWTWNYCSSECCALGVCKKLYGELPWTRERLRSDLEEIRDQPLFEVFCYLHRQGRKKYGTPFRDQASVTPLEVAAALREVV